MVSSPFGYLLYVAPNLLVALAYLLFLKQPLRIRVLVALPSLLFLGIVPLGLGLGWLEIVYPATARAVGIVVSLTGLIACGLVVYNILHTKTWLHLLQVVNVGAGLVLVFVARLVLNGDAS